MTPVLKSVHEDMLRSGVSMTLAQIQRCYKLPPVSDLEAIIHLSGGFERRKQWYRAIPITERPKTAQWRCMDKLGRVRSVFELAQ